MVKLCCIYGLLFSVQYGTLFLSVSSKLIFSHQKINKQIATYVNILLFVTRPMSRELIDAKFVSYTPHGARSTPGQSGQKYPKWPKMAQKWQFQGQYLGTNRSFDHYKGPFYLPHLNLLNNSKIKDFHISSLTCIFFTPPLPTASAGYWGRFGASVPVRNCMYHL